MFGLFFFCLFVARANIDNVTNDKTFTADKYFFSLAIKASDYGSGTG
tara:strand:+ start:2566 stop:2706 length:141 start_codon:yes stop_codon:yes gene_type:complete